MQLDLPTNKQNKYLLAMSGGVDSTVLFHLLLEKQIYFEVAHANFHLRDEDSEHDESFVKFLCKENNIPFHIKSFDVLAFKEIHNASTQMAARTLRYDWFYSLLEEHQLDYILTAHHLNDSMETFFINLSRGTGINGLTGIQHQDKILRPLQRMSKNEIVSYANRKHFEYRHDLTNDTDDYKRNYIRHHIIPELYHLNIDFDYAFSKTLENLENEKQLLNDYIQKLVAEIATKQNENVYFPIESLKKPDIYKAVFHIFAPYGFNHSSEVIKLMDAQNSSEIQSKNYRLIKDRTNLILSPLHPTKKKYILDELNTANSPIPLKLKKATNDKNALVCFDFNKIKFPLSLRVYKSGDVFYPKGMKGKSKKVSKFYKDLKLSKIEKENTWLLCDAKDQILWVVGYRQDERFLPTKNTKIWLVVEN